MKSILISKSKTVLFLFTFCFSIHAVFAAVPICIISHQASSNDTTVRSDKFLLLKGAANNLSIARYQRLSGKKLSLKNKIRYLFIKHEFKPKGKRNDMLPSIEGFFLGLSLGPVGVLIAYLSSKNKKLRHAAIAGGIVSILLFFLFVIFVAAAFKNIPFSFIFPM